MVCAEAATAGENAHQVGQVITIGAPLQGTRLAYIGLGKCAEEMRYTKKNAFLQQLAQRIRQYGDRMHCFYSRSDLIIIPNAAAAVQGTPKTLFADHGHLSYLFSDKAIDKLISLIKPASPKDSPDM